MPKHVCKILKRLETFLLSRYFEFKLPNYIINLFLFLMCPLLVRRFLFYAWFLISHWEIKVATLASLCENHFTNSISTNSFKISKQEKMVRRFQLLSFFQSKLPEVSDRTSNGTEFPIRVESAPGHNFNVHFC